LRKLCVAALVVLLIFSTFSFYSWQKAERELEVQSAVHEESWSMVYLTVSEDLFELGHMGEAFEKLLEQNASEATLIEYADSYYLNARHVGNVFMFLSYCAGGDHVKYQKLWRAFEKLESFLLTVMSRVEVDKTGTVRENLELFKKISNLSLELYRCGDPRQIPPELAEELLNATNELKFVYGEEATP